MKKLSKIITVIIGTATLAIGIGSYQTSIYPFRNSILET